MKAYLSVIALVCLTGCGSKPASQDDVVANTRLGIATQQRVTALEGEVASIKGQVSTNTANIATNRADINSFNDMKSAMDAAIQELESTAQTRRNSPTMVRTARAGQDTWLQQGDLSGILEARDQRSRDQAALSAEARARSQEEFFRNQNAYKEAENYKRLLEEEERRKRVQDSQEGTMRALQQGWGLQGCITRPGQLVAGLSLRELADKEHAAFVQTFPLEKLKEGWDTEFVASGSSHLPISYGTVKRGLIRITTKPLHRKYNSYKLKYVEKPGLRRIYVEREIHDNIGAC